MTLKLRPRQLEALQASKERYDQGVTRQLTVIPTGGGKTVIFACIPQFFGFKKKTLVLAHREELVDQAVNKIRKWNPTLTVGKEMAGTCSDAGDDVVVGSVPTLGRAGSDRILKFRPSEFDAIITDEAHHIAGQTYKNIYAHFGLMEKDNRILHAGFTATANRTDGQGLGQIFDEIVYECSILDFVKEGYLVPPSGFQVKTSVTLDGVKTLAGDFQQDELSAAVNTYDRNALVVKEWLKNGHERSTIGFAVDIAHAKCLAAAFKSAGIAADAVWGDDPRRATKLQDHRNGDLQVLINCAVLTEGYDDAKVDCIVLARPTKSQLLFTQMVGRGLRLPEGIDNLIEARAAGTVFSKEDCLILDVTDSTSKHSLVSLPSLFGLGPRLDLRGKTIVDALKIVEEAQADNPEVDFENLTDIDAINSYIEHVNLFEVKWAPEVTEYSKLRWHKVGDKYYSIMLPNKDYVSIYSNLLDQWTVEGTIGSNRFIEKDLINLPEAFRYAENMMAHCAKEIMPWMRRDANWQKWRSDHATRSQLIALRVRGIEHGINITKGDAQRVLDAYEARLWRATHV